MKNRSFLTNLLEFLEVVNNCIDYGLPVDVIYLDSQKAFDKVPHRRLLHKIVAHEIIAKVNKWIEIWLSGRLQREVLNEVLNGHPLLMA